jgi:hypothetical protein
MDKKTVNHIFSLYVEVTSGAMQSMAIYGYSALDSLTFDSRIDDAWLNRWLDKGGLSSLVHGLVRCDLLTIHLSFYFPCSLPLTIVTSFHRFLSEYRETLGLS